MIVIVAVEILNTSAVSLRSRLTARAVLTAPLRRGGAGISVRMVRNARHSGGSASAFADPASSSPGRATVRTSSEIGRIGSG